MKKKAVSGVSLPLVLGLTLCGDLVNSEATSADCQFHTQDTFSGTVNGSPPPSRENTSVGVLFARRVKGGEINYFGIPWGGLEGCLTVGKWTFKSFDAGYGWSPSWHSGVSCIKTSRADRWLRELP